MTRVDLGIRGRTMEAVMTEVMVEGMAWAVMVGVGGWGWELVCSWTTARIGSRPRGQAE